MAVVVVVLLVLLWLSACAKQHVRLRQRYLVRRACLFELLARTQRVLDAHQVPWFLNGGGCIGALRNNRLIPWDTDVDIGAPVGAVRQLVPPNAWAREGLEIREFPFFGFKVYALDPALNDSKCCKPFLDIFELDWIDAGALPSHIRAKPGPDMPRVVTFATEEARKVWPHEWYVDLPRLDGPRIRLLNEENLDGTPRTPAEGGPKVLAIPIPSDAHDFVRRAYGPRVLEEGHLLPSKELLDLNLYEMVLFHWNPWFPRRFPITQSPIQ